MSSRALVPELLPDPAREHFVLLVREVAARLAADHDVVAEVRVEAERCAAVYDYLRRLFIWAHNSLGREDGQATLNATEAIRVFAEQVASRQ